MWRLEAVSVPAAFIPARSRGKPNRKSRAPPPPTETTSKATTRDSFPAHTLATDRTDFHGSERELICENPCKSVQIRGLILPLLARWHPILRPYEQIHSPGTTEAWKCGSGYPVGISGPPRMWRHFQIDSVPYGLREDH